MTQDKELLLKDICARLPYGVKVLVDNKHWCDFDGHTPSKITFDNSYRLVFLGTELGYVKPYLFPLSSMSDEQNDSWRDAWFPDLMTSTDVNYPESEKYLVLSHVKSLEWLYKNHFDINGLINKGLAIDATGLNIY